MGDPLTNAAMAVLEQVMERALAEAEEARAGENRERLAAMVDVLDWAKVQADALDLPLFADDALNRLDPYSLLMPLKQAA
ncbi:MAG: hypothetical protein MZW92_18885 [Comamonadaceae bacterium]|nr:hypothetical protein [Comamonadaceae bacterium]